MRLMKLPLVFVWVRVPHTTSLNIFKNKILTITVMVKWLNELMGPKYVLEPHMTGQNLRMLLGKIFF